MRRTNGRIGRALRAGAAIVVAGAAVACSGGSVPYEAQQSGSIGVHEESGLVFVADLDNGGVAVVDPGARRVEAFIRTGERPERLVVHGDDVFVSNRRSRTVTHLDATTREVKRQIQVGSEPMGLKVAGDQLIVASSMSGSVEAISLKDFSRRWEAKLGDEVRAVGVLPDGRIFAPGYKSGRMHVIDGRTGAVERDFSFAQPVDPAAAFDRRPTMAQDVVVADDGRVYVPHSQTNQDALPPVVAGYYSNGPAPAVAPGISTFVAAENRLVVERQPQLFEFPDPAATPFPPTMFRPTQAFAGPTVAALDASGQYMYVVNRFSKNVAVVSTTRATFASDPSGCCGVSLGDQGVAQLVPVGNGPNGIAIAPDQKAAYVYNSFDHSLSIIVEGSDGHLVVTREITGITPQTLTQEQQLGRRLFNDASDDRLTLTAAGGVACASCHPDGREDGHNWQFAEGTRNTPMLVGKGLKQTAPYHWDGQFDTFSGFQHVLEKRMGGRGIDANEFEAILAFLDNEPEPENPNRPAPGALTDAQARGRDLFEGRAQCAACHAGEALTDNRFYDVGTRLQTIPMELDGTPTMSPDLRRDALPNTPSLRGLFATAPYLHDGSIATLEARVRMNPGDVHGRTSGLSDAEVMDLVAYLETL